MSASHAVPAGVEPPPPVDPDQLSPDDRMPEDRMPDDRMPDKRIADRRATQPLGVSERPRAAARGGMALYAASRRRRKAPSAWAMARRRLLVLTAKVLMPVAALALLTSIAMWPEIARLTDRARLGVARLAGQIQTGQLFDPVYHGVDERGRPYTLTAKRAHETSPERVNLTAPKGDVLLEGGRWLMVTAHAGIFHQKLGNVDLQGDVTLYRDDGLDMITDSANVDLKAGAAAGAQRVHAEGPFGTLDAQNFAVLDHGTTVQFGGPGRLVLNGGK